MSISIVFVSNFINHHQKPFCDEMYRKCGDDFSFIQAVPMDEERVKMGWNAEEDIPYLHKIYKEKDICFEKILNCDVLLLGWTGLENDDPAREIITKRLTTGRPVIRISERIYREGRYKAISPRGIAAKYKEHTRFRNAPVYLLCAGAYVSGDFRLIGAYPGKMFKWGYFPPIRRYEEHEINKFIYKENEELQLCFAGRFVNLKHPEFAIYAAEYLKNRGIRFHLHMVGDGKKRKEIEDMAVSLGVDHNITFYGSKDPSDVRKIMEKSHIFIFASNYLEGWGAVVNEAMNSVCAVIASGEAGAVPYLIQNGVNGLSYDKCSKDGFLKCLDKLVSEPMLIGRLQRAAYKSIAESWNAEHACCELLKFCESIVAGKDYEGIPESGPMSAANVIKAPGILRTLKEDNHLE